MKISVSKLTEYTIYLYMIIVMVSNDIADLPVKIIRVVTVAVFALYFYTSHKIYKSKYCVWTIIFLLYNFITSFWAFSKSEALEGVETLLYVVIVNLCICQYLHRYKDIVDKIISAFVCGALLQALKIYLSFGPLVFFTSREVDTLSANTIGFNSAIAVVFCLYLYIKNTSNYRYILIALLCFASMILSASRKAILYFLIPIAFYYLVKSKNPIKVLKNMILIAISAVIGWWAIFNIPFLYELLGQRIQGMINGFLGVGLIDDSTNGRLIMISLGMEWFKSRPWFGYGLANYAVLFGMTKNWGKNYYAHNNYVELLVDSGLVGTIIYYFMYIKLLFMGFKKIKHRDPLPVFLLGCLITFIVTEYGRVTYYAAMYQLLLVVMYIIFSEKSTTR